MRNAVIDLGSNTFHAVVADVDRRGITAIVFDDKIAVRIGERAFEQRRIPSEAYARGLDALGTLLERVATVGYDRLKILATGVFREAINGRRFLAEARGRFDVPIELIHGHDEARLTWHGVSAELLADHGRLAVIDLGGGSLECVVGEREVHTAHSLPLGVLRLRDYHADDIRALVATTTLEAIEDLRERTPDTIALSSGTARALLRLGRALGRVATTERRIPRGLLAELARVLAPLRPEQLGELGVEPSRHDTIATGAIVFDAVLDLAGATEVYIAKAALREGALVELLASSNARLAG